ESAALSTTEGDNFLTAAGTGRGGGGFRNRSTNAHPPAMHTASMKTTPAVTTAFCSVVKRGGEDVFSRPSATFLLVRAWRLPVGGTSPPVRAVASPIRIRARRVYARTKR